MTNRNAWLLQNLQRDPELKGKDMAVIFVNQTCGAEAENEAVLVSEEKLLRLGYKGFIGGSQQEETVIQMPESGEVLATFYWDINGIVITSCDFPCVVIVNSGVSSFAIGTKFEDSDLEDNEIYQDGENFKWLEPGEYESFQDADINSPEVRRALDEFIRSPEVMEGVEEARRQMQEKKGAQ